MTSALISISKIRTFISTPPGKTEREQKELPKALRDLDLQYASIIENSDLLDEVLKLTQELEAYKGAGNQYAIRAITRLLGSIITRIGFCLRDREISFATFASFADAQSKAPSHAPRWCVLEKLSVRAVGKIRGPRSKSQHVSSLKVQAWDHLAQIAEWIRDANYITLALECAGDERNLSRERAAAIEFLTEFWGGEDPNQETTDLLLRLEKEAPDRRLLVTVMQAQIDLGIGNEFGALAAVEDWDEEE